MLIYFLPVPGLKYFHVSCWSDDMILVLYSVWNQMDPLNITKGSIVFSRFIPNVDDSLHSFSSYCTEHERRPHAAPMTDEQREEKNRKRHEGGEKSMLPWWQMGKRRRRTKWHQAYERKKCHAHNKKNILGLHMFKLTVGLLCLSHIVHGYVNYYFIWCSFNLQCI